MSFRFAPSGLILFGILFACHWTTDLFGRLRSSVSTISVGFLLVGLTRLTIKRIYLFILLAFKKLLPDLNP